MRNLFIFFLLSISILSCGTENKPTYKVTTTVSPTEGGTITLNPSGGVYSEGETVIITANPSNGWRFVRWEGDWSGEANPSTLNMTKDYSVIGIFEKKNYPLTINIEGYGEVEERVIQQKTTEYPYQTVVELTPVHDNGWRFVEWSGDLSGSEVPKTITVDGEKTVNVKFERKNYPLTINIVGEGTVTETVLPQRTTEYPFETVVVLESIPSEGWEFVEWSGDLSGNENPQMIVVDGDKEVTVTFVPTVYLSENGITIMCPNRRIGEKGLVDGIEYEVVDRNLLIQRRNEGEDLSKVCTSNVTNMSSLFRGQSDLKYSFDNSIENWDVSSVTNMAGMFQHSNFNRPIEIWDVSKVTSMALMFYDSEFNQSIGSWNVGNVTDMNQMFALSSFNQPIGDWNLSKVKDMSSMFFRSKFNQPIGNWDVSSVTNMNSLFMGSTGELNPFNQPIGNWDVSNVVRMMGMFEYSSFNQPINKWCVIKIPIEPEIFSVGSPLLAQYKPKWGTCPTR
jgi:surface protein